MSRRYGSDAGKPLNNVFKFTLLVTAGLILLTASSFAFMLFGAEHTQWRDVLDGLFRYDGESFIHVVIHDIRLPRLLADIMVGVCLSVAGAVMQGNTKNPMADSGLMGISSGSVFAILLMMLFVPDASRLERIGYSFLGAASATLLIYGVAMLGRRKITSDRMVLAGMAISTLFGSVTTAVMLRGGLSAEMMKYSAGSSANTLWSDIAVAAPFFIAGFGASIILARSLTILNLGRTSPGASAQMSKSSSSSAPLWC